LRAWGGPSARPTFAFVRGGVAPVCGHPQACHDYMKVYLVGFMATGKTTVGQAAADRLGWRFVDLDDRVEAALGMTVGSIFAELGEPAFRGAESKQLEAVAGEAGHAVVATGGGVVISDRNMAVMRGSGVVVRLAASVDSVLDRAGEGPARPLLQGGDRRERVVELMREREWRYALADVAVDTEAGIEDAVAAVVEVATTAAAGRWTR